MSSPSVSIGPSLCAKWPHTALACVTARVNAAAPAPALTEEMRAREQEILRLPDPRSVLESPQIAATRAAYKALGKDPARYRGSAEALLRRIIAHKGVPKVNGVVDVINLVSLESRLPIGLYDLARVRGDIVFRPGKPGESYKGIGKYDLNLENLPIFSDALGPHGSPTSDSERTMVTAETQRVLAIIISFGPGSQDAASGAGNSLERWAQRIVELLDRHTAAQECEISFVP